MADLTPMMRQYLEIKEQNKDSILFFRLGDFYEMFNEDAKLAARELDLVLTTRDRSKSAEEQTPMCGIPYHSSDGYIARLIAKGYKVAICEQTEDPALAKGLVKRDIIRVVTPGTVIDSACLDDRRGNFLCGVFLDEQNAGVAFCDMSTGHTHVTAFSGADRAEHLCNELARFSPAEAVLSAGAYADEELKALLADRLSCRVERGDARFDLKAAEKAVLAQYGEDAYASLPRNNPAAALALGGLSKGVTTREMAAAYATFARGGVYTTPRTYTEVLDHNGNVILENKTESHAAMKESTAYAMNELLKNVVRNGTGTGANFSGMTIAGKTGSTNSNNDRYFVGYTPYYTAAVWVGYDTPTRIVASGNPAATLWKTFMSKVHAGLPNKDFEVSSADMVSVTVCTQTGLLASAGCPSQTVKVAKDYAPSLSCDGHISVTVCADSGMLASDYCPNVTTAYVLDLSQPNVSSGWGYKRELLTTPLSAALQATYQAQLEEGLISSIPAGEPVRTNSGTVQLYSDLMYRGMCTTHTTPLEPTPDPDAPDDGSGTTPDGDATTGGDSGTQTPSDNTGTAGDSASGDVGDNGQFLNWLLNNGGTGR